MNDIRKERIMIGILGSLLLFTLGCGKKEVTFVQTKEELETEDGAEWGSAQDGATEEMQDKAGQLLEEGAYNEKGEHFQTSEDTHRIFVHVCGAVLVPGVYELPEDARAFLAIEKAGGFLEDAYEEALNLAKPLEDGEQLFIPTLEEWEQGKGTAAAGMEEEKATEDGLININTASKEELCTLPGVGESRAESIVSYREANGGFLTIEEIMNVTGIKEGLFGKIKDKIKVK
ncbi:MAG: ComEA family DNA-binding protein [Lachnospiraceae bacterium]|nr:ComEA family DNA-binding protein [Lachnospiraceae bacterium]